MFHKVSTVSVFVADQQRAMAFYTEKLGMELRRDAPLFPGSDARWIAVAPSGAETEIILYLPDENWEHYRDVVGQSQSITLAVEDMAATYAELKARGVECSEPDSQPWGTFAMLTDSEGNRLILVQQPS
jgi:predicted enzyme related to lactoylglutathione lyase